MFYNLALKQIFIDFLANNEFETMASSLFGNFLLLESEKIPVFVPNFKLEPEKHLLINRF